MVLSNFLSQFTVTNMRCYCIHGRQDLSLYRLPTYFSIAVIFTCISNIGVFQNSRTYFQFEKSDHGIGFEVCISFFLMFVYIPYCVNTVWKKKLENVGLKVQGLQEGRNFLLLCSLIIWFCSKELVTYKWHLVYC